jgi:hypothetical protein
MPSLPPSPRPRRRASFTPISGSRHHRRSPTPPMPLLPDENFPLGAHTLGVYVHVFPGGTGPTRIPHSTRAATHAAATHAPAVPAEYGTLPWSWSFFPVRAVAGTDVLKWDSISRARGYTRSLRSRALGQFPSPRSSRCGGGTSSRTGSHWTTCATTTDASRSTLTPPSLSGRDRADRSGRSHRTGRTGLTQKGFRTDDPAVTPQHIVFLALVLGGQSESDDSHRWPYPRGLERRWRPSWRGRTRHTGSKEQDVR